MVIALGVCHGSVTCVYPIFYVVVCDLGSVKLSLAVKHKILRNAKHGDHVPPDEPPYVWCERVLLQPFRQVTNNDKEFSLPFGKMERA